jgi:hypothetical protein
MSRIISVPARYAPFVEQTLAAMQATIDCDELLSGTDSPWPTGTIVKDERQTGDLLICVAQLPADGAHPLFPQEQPAQERIAS